MNDNIAVKWIQDRSDIATIPVSTDRLSKRTPVNYQMGEKHRYAPNLDSQ